MTFKELQDAALGTSFDGTKYRSYAQRFINRAQQRVARGIGMGTMQALATVTTTQGVSTYDVPVDFIQLRGDEPILGPMNFPLVQLDVGDLLSAPALMGAATSGEPRYFAYDGNQIRFFPTPDTAQAFTMVYRATAPRLVNDDDEPAIPEAYHELLVLYAKGRLYQEEDDPAAGAPFMAQFEQELREARGELVAATAFRRQAPRMWNVRPGPTFRRPT